jgi:hypothetical protein
MEQSCWKLLLRVFLRLLKIRAEQAIILIALTTVGFLLVTLWHLLILQPDERVLSASQAPPRVRDTLVSCKK